MQDLSSCNSPNAYSLPSELETQNQLTLLDTIQASILISYYYLGEGHSIQGRYHAAAAATLGSSAAFRMHSDEAATIPGPVLKRIKEEIDGLD